MKDTTNKLEQARIYIAGLDLPDELKNFGEDEVGNYADEKARGWYYYAGASRTFDELTPDVLSKSFDYFIAVDESHINDEKAVTIGSSKIMGLPHLPDSIEWPEGLYFYAQLNLAELHKYDLISLLPTHGMLYFFWIVNDYKCKVIYYNGSENLNIREYSPEMKFINEKYYLKKYKESGAILNFEPNCTFHIDDINELIPKQVKDQLYEIINCELKEYHPETTVLGKPFFYQGENEVFSNEQENNYKNEVLLFQHEFGEGHIHFWIPKQALTERDFSQCYLTYSGT